MRYKNNIRIVTLTYGDAKYARKLKETLYIGNRCNIYEDIGEILCAEDGDCSYYEWMGTGFEAHEVRREFKNAVLTLETVTETPFELDRKYSYELHIGGERALLWKKIKVSSDRGFAEINEVCDAAQIYADGELIADYSVYAMFF